jgi:hypothetical protein
VDIRGIAGAHETWRIRDLEFVDGGSIHVGAIQLNLIIRRNLVSSTDKPVIVSFPQDSVVARPGQDGTPGMTGQPGSPPGGAGQEGQPGGDAGPGYEGQKGPNVQIVITRPPRGRFLVNLRGQDGGPGGTGGMGGRGGTGARGSAGTAIVSSSARCEQSPGPGGPGGNGGSGGSPGHGGRCGEGGRLILQAPSENPERKFYSESGAGA